MLAQDGETIIINGGTTYRMAEFLGERRLHILTRSPFTMADYLLRYTSNRVLLPGGEVYRASRTSSSVLAEQDTTVDHLCLENVHGRVCDPPAGLIEADPLLIKAEQKLIKQAEQLIVLVDSNRVCRVRESGVVSVEPDQHTLITDSGVSETTVAMLEQGGD
ncbi:MAG: hypothetical protein R3E89_19755 [Thiolinea sp.]